MGSGLRYFTAALVVALAVAGCGREQTQPAQKSVFRGASIILISIDTLRADHLPAYGYTAGSTPTLDALARDGIVFEDLYSHCPLTLPSHASLLTGLLPFRHGVRDNIGYSLAAGRSTVATRLKAAGYRTGAAVSVFVLRHQTGIAQGFDFFDDVIQVAGTGESLSDSQRDGQSTVDALAAWIDREGNAPVFAFLHLYEPHTPYAPPARHRMANPYDGEVAYADELVGRFLGRLNARGLLAKSIVAVVSDHGEGLNDHGEAEHGIFLYREALHVPWLLKLPQGAGVAGHRIAGTVGVVDVPATLLDLVGAPVDGLDGRSLAPVLSATRAADRTVYSETLYPRLHFGWSDLASATDGRYRFIRAPRPELFDLSTDPHERRNVVDQQRPAASAMRAWLDRAAADAPAAGPTPATSEARERLKSLGYVTSSSPVRAGTSLPDPKDGIRSYEALKKANSLAGSGRDAEAIADLQRLVAVQPNMLDAWESLAKSFVKLNRQQDAIAAFGKVLAIDPVKPETHLALARIYALDGEKVKAREHAQLAVERDPGAANEVLAELAMDEGRFAEAAAFARRSVEADGSRYMSHFVLGTIAHRQGRCDEATSEFRRAIETMKVEPHAVVRNLHAGLADCLARSGHEAEAEREFQAELALIPASQEGRVGLATLYRSQGRDAEARTVLNGLIANAPRPTADTYFDVVRAFSVLGDVDAAREWAARARERFPRDPRFR
jgi:choline-sulfatase